MSHEPVTWRIHLDEGARLAHVLHDGRGLVELPPGGPLAKRAERLPSIYSLSSEDEFESGNPEKALRSLERSAGQAVDAFQGSYKSSAFVVPFFHDGSVVREVGAKVRELQKAKTTSMTSPFDLVIGNALVRFNDPNAEGGRGTIVAFNRRDEVRGAAEVDGKFYAITESAFFVHDPKTGAATELHVPVGYPDPSRWRGIAYDAKMKRLVMTAQSSDYAYACDPVSGEWRLFPWDYKTRPPLFGGAITFDREEGLFYGITSFWPPQTQSRVVVVLDSLLHPQRTIKLSNPDAIPFGLDPEVQLAKAGHSLVVHVQPGFFGGVRETCLLIGLRSGEVRKLEACSLKGGGDGSGQPFKQETEVSIDDF
jgi:hypothetical protein